MPQIGELIFQSVSLKVIFKEVPSFYVEDEESIVAKNNIEWIDHYDYQTPTNEQDT